MRGSAICENFAINFRKKPDKPKKLLIAVTSLGIGKFLIEFNSRADGWIPFSLTFIPKNITEFIAKLHLEAFKVNPAALNLSKTISNLC